MQPKKRCRTKQNAYTEEIPLGTNDFTFGRSQEVVVNQGFTRTIPISPQKGSKSWIKVANWEPEDRLDYALDPPSDNSNEDLWNMPIYPDKLEGISLQPQAKAKMKKKSLQSSRPHLYWRLNSQDAFLDELLQLNGRGNSLNQQRVLSVSQGNGRNQDGRDVSLSGAPASSDADDQGIPHDNFYRAYCKVTECLSGLIESSLEYRALVRMRRGRTADGELVVQCPFVSSPRYKSAKGWESDKKNADLYALRVAMDANFRLKEQLVSSHSRDPGLNDGKGYFVRQEPYEKYILLLASEEDISTCVGFQAIIKATTWFSKGLQYTGVGAVGCAQAKMWLPNGAGSLHKGKRYGNMDYVFASVLRQYLGIVLVIVAYNIVCQWFINLFARIENQWPPDLRPPAGTTFIPVIGKFHEPAHKTKNHQQFSANLILLMGMSDWELLERLWGIHNILGNATQTMGPGTRIDVLEAHFGFHNWEKYVGHGKTLWQKYKDGLQDRNRQREAYEGLMNSLPEELVQKWEALFKKWESQEWDRVCMEGLCDMEICLCQARCHDALQGLRHTLRVKTRMLIFKNANVRGQRDWGRSRDIIDGIHDRDWEKELLPLRNGDVQSYTDVQKKKGPGRRGTNEEGPDDEGEDSMDGVLEAEEEELNLLSEERDRWDGTGQLRQVISWIWRTTPVSIQDGADNDNELLHVEWGRSRARIGRALEEVQYAREDMQRTVEFMQWKAEWWVERAGRRSVESEVLREGLKAYALKQAAVQRQLKDMCISNWKKPLDGKEHTEDAIDTELRMMLGVSNTPDEEDEEEEGGGLYDDDEGEDLGWA
ncbi:hypothetical protein BT96DRAFT_1003441 [Gymnopus androsaceus JB14]|uniref:CxC2-like cysteine cluster KDZ transposase-associated domain-containing protein n=1 Tax=Gymnopus androsaceus JB14 TaxID=1447944 RepID=A0A6A4GVY8_9AGAR|nr:hypothetical protein BT96DRAFT_1003441 [Gymnopus androsaceus JB14]